MFNIFKKKVEKPYVTAVIAAGGSSARMEGENKLLIELADAPVLAYTLMAFEKCDSIDEIIVVAKSEMIVPYSEICNDFDISKVSKVITGGRSRAESVYRGLCEMPEHTQYACVHDGARPLVLPCEITAVCERAFDTSCAIAAAAVKDTIKMVQDGRITSTVERSPLYAAQTPQVADSKLLIAAIKQAIEHGTEITDESSALEVMGFKPSIVTCSYNNFKITTPEDVIMAQAILGARGERI